MIVLATYKHNIDWILKNNELDVFYMIENLSIHVTNTINEFKRKHDESIFNNKVMPIFMDWQSLLTDFDRFVSHKLNTVTNQLEKQKYKTFKTMINNNYNLTHSAITLILKSMDKELVKEALY